MFLKINFVCLVPTNQFERDFRPPDFLIIRTGLGHWKYWNIFVFGLRFAEIFEFFWISAQYDVSLKFLVKSPRSIILRRVKQLYLRGNLPAVSYCTESQSSYAKYHTAQSHTILRGVNRQLLKTFTQTFKGTMS